MDVNNKGIYFSIVIPCYNAKKTIEGAIVSCIAQSFTSFEIIIVDDASNDGTVQIVKRLIKNNPNIKIRLVRQLKNSGPSLCRNLGWEQAKGEFIAFLDADDIWNKDKLYICHHWISILNCDLLAHSYSNFLDELSIKAQGKNYTPKMKSYYSLLVKNISQTSCIVVRNSLTMMKHFEPSMRYTEDHELWLRIAYYKSCYFINGEALTILGRPQLSEGGLSGNRWAMRKGELKMYIKSANYSKVSFLLLPLLVLFSLTKFIKKEISIKLNNQ